MRISVFDIGGTFIKHSIFNGSVLSPVQLIETRPRLGAESVIHTVSQVILRENAEQPLDGIGISTRGQVDFSHGVIIFDPPDLFPDYSGCNFRSRLLQNLNGLAVPILIENDGNCAAIAEHQYGASKLYSDCLCLVYGTGIGGGIIYDNKIYRGSNYSAGEFGMMQFPVGDDYIFYEQAASVSALVEMAVSADPSLCDGKKIVEAASGGKDFAKNILKDWCGRVAAGLVSLVHVFNPACLVLGGGIMESHVIVDEVRSCTLSRLAPGFEQIKILPAALGNQAGMLGAGYLVMESLKENSHRNDKNRNNRKG